MLLIDNKFSITASCVIQELTKNNFTTKLLKIKYKNSLRSFG